MLLRSYSLIFTAIAAAALGIPSRVHAQHNHGAHDAAVDSVTAATLATQVARVRAATARYASIDSARKDGYVMFGREERPLMGEHWYREELVHSPLDLTKPSTLQYATINGKRTLVGVAYTVYQKPGEPVPDGFAGSSDHWHVHDITRMTSAFTAGRPVLAAIAANRQKRNNPAVREGRTNLVMVHAWTGIENPDGMFADKHRALPYLQAGLPASYAKGATENAAWGIALVQRDACDGEIRSTNSIAQLSRTQKSRLESACAIAEGKVLKAHGQKLGADKLNAAADDAWTVYLAERDKTLTPAQKARMASVVEHPTGG